MPVMPSCLVVGRGMAKRIAMPRSPPTRTTIGRANGRSSLVPDGCRVRVSLSCSRRIPRFMTMTSLIVQADGAGNLYSDEWAPDDHDLGVRFYLTAAGSQSRAQMTFTDDVVANDVAGPSETVTIMPGGSAAVTFTLTASNTVPAGDASGCNATGSSRATLTVSRPPVVTVSPGSGEFVGCGNGLSFTFSSSVVGSYPIGVSVTGGKVGSSYNTAAAAFTLVVAAANAAPVANAQNVATPEDSPLALTLTASDADNDVVTFSVVAPPAHGVVTGTLPNVTYTQIPTSMDRTVSRSQQATAHRCRTSPPLPSR